jgi:hypothetical protein
MWNRRDFSKAALAGAGGLIVGARQTAAQMRPPDVIKHFEVYREPGMFAGWPANHGAWQWGDELLFGFEVGHFKETERGHAIDYSKPAEHVLARSMDGGETWEIERPASLQPPAGAKVAGVPTGASGKEPVDCPGGIDFTNRNFVFTARMLDINTGPSRFYYSMDRGKTWEGPFNLSIPQYPGMAARTDYQVLGKHDLLLFTTVPKSDGREGRPVVIRTMDGGKNWKLHGTIGGEPEPGDYAIMPATVRGAGNQLLTVIRKRALFEAYRSDTLGEDWVKVRNPVEGFGGNPASLVRTLSGQLVLVYGWRTKPFGIRAKVSDDFGTTWGNEMRLRADGAGWDLGYVRTFLRPDGNLVSVYYYNDSKSPERYIGGTIWFPGDRGYKVADPGYNNE